MSVWCCACRRAIKNEENVQFHRFPKYQKDAWMNKLGLVGDPKYWRVCSEHFRPEDYYPAVVSGKPRLKNNAIPSLKLKRCKINESNSNDNNRIEVADNQPLEVEEIKKENSPNIIHDVLGPYKESLSEIDHHSYCVSIRKETSSEVIPFLSSMKPSSKRKVSSRTNEMWEDFGDDKEFLNYRKISDVQWEKIVHDPMKTTICWNVATETLNETMKENKILRAKNNKLKLKILNLERKMEYLKKRNISTSAMAIVKLKKNQGNKRYRGSQGRTQLV